ncbi:hypothetical protein BC827DRAFT_1272342 [Russula dissimulans]|nr:hypothetical protein BC827DRAFT_1272342 [Russula dissimulans]
MSTSSKESRAFTDLSFKSPLDDLHLTPDAGEPTSLLAEVNRRGIVPTNYLRAFRPITAVERQYALDLSLPPQNSVDSKSPAEDYNLSLHTTSGSISTEIWIIHDENGHSKRALMEFCSYRGSIDVQVHDPSYPAGNSHARPSVNIEVFSWHRDVSVSLPRCFRGTITILSSHERIAFSPDLEACTVPLMDIQKSRVYFVGGPPRKEKCQEGDSDKGRFASECPEEPRDSLIVDGVTSSLRINWVGEEELEEMKPPEKNLWETLWGGLQRVF